MPLTQRIISETRILTSRSSETHTDRLAHRNPLDAHHLFAMTFAQHLGRNQSAMWGVNVHHKRDQRHSRPCGEDSINPIDGLLKICGKITTTTSMCHLWSGILYKICTQICGVRTSCTKFVQRIWTTNDTYHQLGSRTPSFPQSRSEPFCILSHSYRGILKSPAITVVVFPPGQVLATWHAIWDQSVDTRSGGHLQWQVPSYELRRRELEVNAQVKNKLRSQDKDIFRYDTSWLYVIMSIYYE